MAKYNLTIQVSEHSVLFQSTRDGNILNSAQVDISSEVESSINQAYSDNSFLKDQFDDITLSWTCSKSTLVPNSVFAETSPKDIFELCYGKNQLKGDVDFNRIAELSVSNIFEIPAWVKRVFIMKHPTIIVQHEGTHVSRQIINKEAFYLKATIILSKDSFLLTIVKHNKLEFYTYFDYQNADDIIYHTLFALKQKELTNEKGLIELVAGLNASTNEISKAEVGFGKIKELSEMKISRPENFILKAQLLCV